MMNFFSSLFNKKSESNNTQHALYKRGHLVKIPDFVQKEIDRSAKRTEALIESRNNSDYKLRLVIKNALRDLPQFSEKKKDPVPPPDDKEPTLIVPLLLGVPLLSLSCYMLYSFLRRRV